MRSDDARQDNDQLTICRKRDERDCARHRIGIASVVLGAVLLAVGYAVGPSLAPPVAGLTQTAQAGAPTAP